MSDSIMYQEDSFVVLESDREEEFLSAAELKEKLKNILVTQQDNLPRILDKFASPEEQAQHLMDNYYEFDLGAGQYLQWYVVRLEK
jgi:Protein CHLORORESPIRATORY REDUCTION 7